MIAFINSSGMPINLTAQQIALRHSPLQSNLGKLDLKIKKTKNHINHLSHALSLRDSGGKRFRAKKISLKSQIRTFSERKTLLESAEKELRMLNSMFLVTLGQKYLEEAGAGATELYEQAFKFFKLAADEGDANAQIQVGNMYMKGIGVKASYQEPMKYFMLALEKNEKEALKGLAYLWKNGSLNFDLSKITLEELEQLAVNGDLAAQKNLMYMYRRGEGGAPQNHEKAAQLCQLFADQGNVDAQYRLGKMYEKGHGKLQDDTMAFRYYRLAAKNFNYWHVNRHVNLDKVEYKFATYKANKHLGQMYQEGKGTPKSEIKASKYYKFAADIVASEVGNRDAQIRLQEWYNKKNQY